MNRNEMKSLVKECLMEILRDGIGNVAQSSIPSQQQRQGIVQAAQRGRQVADTPIQQRPLPTHNLKEVIKREAGGNRVMESILADTAASTLPQMLKNESRTPQHQPRGIVEKVVASTAPEEIFGSETASRWADLAFMGVKDR